MKTLKIIVLVLVIGAVFTVGVSAQESYIKTTFDLGFMYASGFGGAGYFATGLSVEFVDTMGITYGLQTGLGLGSFPYGLTAFGMGYTYNADVWCVGGKLMFVPVGVGGLGINASGTYWFGYGFGVTGAMDFYFSVASGGGVLFSMRAGISKKF